MPVTARADEPKSLEASKAEARERFDRGLTDGFDAPARARWPLDPSAEKVRGAGVKA